MNYRPHQHTPREMNAALSDFAELLSREVSLTDIARIMGVTRATPCVLLRWLYERMGEPV